MRIVVADDETHVREGIVSVIREVAGDAQIIGHAATVEEVETQVRLYRPDLVLLDIRMPGGTGFDAFSAGREVSPHTIWVVVSSYSMFDYARTALKLGAFDYLLKPVAPDEMRVLLDSVRSEISRRAVSQSSAGEIRDDIDNGDGRASDSASAAEADPAVRARKLIAERYDRSIGVAQIADQVGVSANYLSTRFRERFGESPLRFLVSVRMERAAELLTGGYRVKEVAPMVGYSDTRHFSRAFARYFGVQPSAFRGRGR